MTPDLLLAIAAGSVTTAGASLLVIIGVIADNRRLKARIRAEDRERLDWLRSVSPDPTPAKLLRIPKGQPGAGRFVSTKETELTG